MYDGRISNYTENKFRRNGINVIVNARVEQVLDGKIIYKLKAGELDDLIMELPYGLCLWSTGVCMHLRICFNGTAELTSGLMTRLFAPQQ